MQLTNARLLTVTDGHGHTSLGQNTCASEVISRYLIDATLDADQIQCVADR